MHFIDRVAGTFLCLLVAPWGAWKRWFGRLEAAPVRRVVLFKLFGMGSLIAATPLFLALRRHFPGLRLTLVTFEKNRVLAESWKEIDEVLTLRSDGLAHFLCDAARIWERLRQNRNDVAIDLEFFVLFTALMAFASGCRRRVGFHCATAGRHFLFTDTVPFDRNRHISQNFMALMRPFGVLEDELDVERAVLAVPETKNVNIESVFERLRLKKPFGVMNPNASGLALERRWPMKSFQELIRRLIQIQPAVQIVLIGELGEKGYVEELLATGDVPLGNRVVNAAGQTTVLELAELLRHAAYVVTNDSGPMHLAAIFHTPTISLFGPESPVLYRPMNPQNISLFARNFPCSPCMSLSNAKRAACNGKNRCMEQISVDEVVQIVQKWLPSQKGPQHEV